VQQTVRLRCAFVTVCVCVYLTISFCFMPMGDCMGGLLRSCMSEEEFMQLYFEKLREIPRPPDTTLALFKAFCIFRLSKFKSECAAAVTHRVASPLCRIV
jgi:hypothetical protein